MDLISSQIDADRMDYLKRDAYFTGVTYGDFDLARILRVIRPYHNKIVFQIQGTHAVEDYIVSRYQMHMQVYFHHVSRGMEVTLERMLARAKHLYQRGDLLLTEGFYGLSLMKTTPYQILRLTGFNHSCWRAETSRFNFATWLTVFYPESL